MAWQTIVPKSGRCSTLNEYAVRLAIHDRKDTHPRFVITIGKSFMKKMRWQIGDKVRIRFDPASNIIGLDRCNTPEAFLIASSGGSKHQKSVIGRIAMDSTLIPIGKFLGETPRTLVEGEILIDGELLVIPSLHESK